MKKSSAQKMRLVLAVFAFVFLIIWSLIPCTTLQRVLGISASACMMLSMLISFFHEKKKTEK